MEEELQLENTIQYQEEVVEESVAGGSGADIDTTYVNENVDYVIQKTQQQEIGDEDEDKDKDDDDNDDDDEEDEKEEDEDEYYKFDSKSKWRRISCSDAMKYTYIVVTEFIELKDGNNTIDG